MKRILALALILAAGCGTDREVTVRIFSKHVFHEAIIVSENTSCSVRLEKGKLHARYNGGKEQQAEGYLFAGKSGSYTITAAGVTRKYEGAVRATVVKGEEGIVILNRLPLEKYTAAVCASEFEGMGYLYEFAMAAAVTVRSFTVHAKKRHSYAGFCDLTHCQQYRGAGYNREKWGKAALDTAGVVLKNKNGKNHYFYSACCGGVLEAPEEFAGARPAECGKIREDAINGVYLCASHRHFRWKKFVTAREINEALPEAGFEITGMKTLSRTCSGRPSVFEFEGAEGRTYKLAASKFRSLYGRAHGWNVFYSNHFEISKQGEGFMTEGRGFGHGAGLCAEGALNMAVMGYGYEEILKHYFEGSGRTKNTGP